MARAELGSVRTTKFYEHVGPGELDDEVEVVHVGVDMGRVRVHK